MKHSELYSKLKNEWKKNWKKIVVDIFIFGSLARGKSQPRDIDMCIIFRDKIDIAVIKKIQTLLGEKYHVSALSAENFFTNPHSLIKTLLLEGLSVLTRKKFSEVFSLKPCLLYSYDLSNEDASRKVKFVQLLRGRKTSQGMVARWKGEFIANNIFLVPINNDADAQEVFNAWRIKHSRKRIFLMA